MGSYGKVLFVVAAAAVAFASLMVLDGAPNRVAHADPPVVADGEFWVWKDCSTPVAELFTINVALFATDPGGVEPDFDETLSFELACDESFEVTATAQWADFAQYIGDFNSTDASATVSEVNLLDLVTPGFSAECTLGAGDMEALIEETDGFLCTVTNDIDLPDLTVNKACPNGFGEAPAFILILDGLDVDGGDNDDIVCTGSVIFADLEPGTYSLEEFIGGADEFSTIITCVDANGPNGEAGLLIEVVLDLSANAACTVTNWLEDDDGLIDINNTNNNIINVNSENTNDNANNNANDNNNANENNNDNNNENTNTQNQTNNQSQTNNNDQSTNVTSSPEVNISGAGAGTGSASAGGVAVAPPSTGDGGLLGLERQGAGYVTWGAVASVLALVLSAATARYVRNES